MSEAQTPELDPDLNEALTTEDILSIRESPLGHEAILEAEGATTYDFGGGRIEPDEDRTKWHDTSGRSIFDVLDLCYRNDAGALVMSPMGGTGYVEFRLNAPRGMAKECTCNNCWNRFWIPPFHTPGECPFCHERGFHIATRSVINGE